MGPMPEASGSGVADESDYSTFENKTGLAEDMKFLASMPELCDVTFLVGDTREPVCAVKAVLAARSRFVKNIFELTQSNNVCTRRLTFYNSQSLPQDAVSSSQSATQKRAAGAREQDSAFPQTQLRAVVEFAERGATGT